MFREKAEVRKKQLDVIVDNEESNGLFLCENKNRKSWNIYLFFHPAFLKQ
jgi:hypothetical protein